MKKPMIISIAVIISLFLSCNGVDEYAGLNANAYYEDFVFDDEINLSEALTKQYDIDDLKIFFKDSNVCPHFINHKKILYIDEVNNAFPIEIIRSGQYSVYKVKQGGCFYVFWEKSYIDSVNDIWKPMVFFTAYISEMPNRNEFESIISGISTAQDVYEIDPAFDIVDYLSSGFFSYSLLNENQLMEIEYEHEGHLTSFEDLVVKSIEVVPRNSINIATRFKAILQDDIAFIEGN